MLAVASEHLVAIGSLITVSAGLGFLVTWAIIARELRGIVTDALRKDKDLEIEVSLRRIRLTTRSQPRGEEASEERRLEDGPPLA